MPRPLDKWTVLPHKPIETIDDNILAVEGAVEMPLGKFPRRMTVVRITGQRLVIHSGIALDEPEMARIESFGRPSFFIVPSAIHRLDVKIWKQRYPELTIACPFAARSKVEELVKVDTIAPDFGDPAVHYAAIKGTAEREGALIVNGSKGTTLVLNDLIFNVRKQPGVAGFLFALLGVTGPEAKIAKVAMKRLVDDKGALRAQLEQWANLSNLRRIIVSHGALIETDPRATLRRTAASLS
jgi:hypothetical protein